MALFGPGKMLRAMAATAPPPGDPPVATGGQFADDEIRELGDRIARLTQVQARELKDYLEERIGGEVKG